MLTCLSCEYYIRVSHLYVYYYVFSIGYFMLRKARIEWTQKMEKENPEELERIRAEWQAEMDIKRANRSH